MKKLVIFVLISALLAFTAATIALAHDNGNNWKNFHGTYEMISSGSCMHSESGYNETAPPFTPVDLSKIYVGTTVAYGTFTFNRGGKGTFTITNYVTILPGGVGYPAGLPFVKQATYTDVPFDFVITPFGDINVTTGNVTTGFSHLIGTISTDKKTMALFSANEVQVFSFPLWSTICNTARTLIKVSD